MLNRKQARPARLLRRAVILWPLLLALLPVTPAQAAISGSGFVWISVDGSGPPSSLQKFDFIGLSSGFTPFVEHPPAHFRGVAVDSHGNVWYSSVVVDLGFPQGDGRIYKTDTLGTVQPSIPDPGRFRGPGIGALDIAGKNLVAITHNPGAAHAVYVMDPDTGLVEASCLVANSSDTVTLAVQRGTFFTDGGVDGHRLDQYMLPETPSEGACTFVASFDLPFRLGGIDFAKGGRLFATDANSGTVHDLGEAPYTTSLGSFPASGAQDISAVRR